MDRDKNTTACAASSDEVKVTANDVDNGIVITAQPIPENPSESEPILVEEKKRRNMVKRGDYVYTTKVTSTSTHRWDDRGASFNCGAGGDAECCEVILACLLCRCLFGGDGSGGGDCGDCCSGCECRNCDCDCGNCDFGDCDCDSS